MINMKKTDRSKNRINQKKNMGENDNNEKAVKEAKNIMGKILKCHLGKLHRQTKTVL